MMSGVLAQTVLTLRIEAELSNTLKSHKDGSSIGLSASS